VRSARIWIRIVGLTLLVGGLVLPAQAEDVEKKFRIGFGAGFLNTQDNIPTDSTNNLILVDSFLTPVDAFRDPRSDSAAFGTLELKPGPIATIFGQYAVTRVFVIEASVGYQTTELGDVEVQVQFDGMVIPDTQRFDFQIYRYEVGEVERIPAQLTFLARFRPRASLNPYLGGGFGYTFVGFEPTDEFNELSVNMDSSQGAHYAISSGFFGNDSLGPTPAPIRDLDGAKVEIGGTWEAHLVAGLEISFKRKWAVILDARYSFSSRSATISFDGGGDLGVAVPRLTDYCGNPPGQTPPGGDLDTVCPGSLAGEQAIKGVYGPTRVTYRGLLDEFAGVVARPDAPDGTNCDDPDDRDFCMNVFEPDGELDPGFYYAQGGSFKYDAFSLQVGIRYTF
jgi:hypothetical protein